MTTHLHVCNTQGTAGGPGGRDRTLAVKRRKNARKKLPQFFFLKKKRGFFGRFSAFYGQRSVTAAWATRSPWSILLVFT